MFNWKNDVNVMWFMIQVTCAQVDLNNLKISSKLLDNLRDVYQQMFSRDTMRYFLTRKVRNLHEKLWKYTSNFLWTAREVNLSEC